jgi:branched-chain amino acid aminotransferase
MSNNDSELPVATANLADGVAWMEGRYMPIVEARIPVTDWGFTRADSTYDVVHVVGGAFFRLDDHLDRFERSLRGFRLVPPTSRSEIRTILHRCVALSGLRDAYVAMVSTRGRPRIAGSRRPADCDNTFIAYALPWIDVIPRDVQTRGAHLWVASVPRINVSSVDPTFKNYLWRDFTVAVLEAHDHGYDTAVLLDTEGFVTEGAGFNVFVVKDNVVTTPDRGALEGITRRSTLELCEALQLQSEVAPLRLDQLMQADEVFCTTTAGGIMPCSRVGNLSIGNNIIANDSPGPISLALKELYWQRHREGWYASAIDYADILAEDGKPYL